MKEKPLPSHLFQMFLSLTLMTTALFSLGAQDTTRHQSEEIQKEIGEPSINHRSDKLPADSETVIYKSVDTSGRVSYSDVPNPDALKEEQLSMPVYSQTPNLERSKLKLEQMAATTKRLQEDRRARESKRRRDSERNKPQAAPYPQVVIQNRSYRPSRFRYPMLYPPYPYRQRYDTDHQGSEVDIRLSGGSSKFRYGLNYNSQQTSHQRRYLDQSHYPDQSRYQNRNHSIQTPYRSNYRRP